MHGLHINNHHILYTLTGSLLFLLSGFLVLSFLAPFTVDNSYAGSTSNSYDTTVNIAPNLSISATDVSINDTPEASGSWLTGTSNVVVSTNNATGYKLYVSSSDSQVDLVNSDSSSAKISNLPAETTESTFRSDSSLMNHYGFTHDNNGSDPESGQITTGTYLPITDINNSRLIKATEEKQNISTTNVTFATKVDRSIPAREYTNTITFTAIANPVTNTLKQAAEKAGITTMQGLTQDVCAAADIYQSGEEDLTLTDTRDNSTYQVRKLADGNCWMVQNLKLGSTSKMTLHNTDTDITDASWTLPASSNIPASYDNAQMHIGTASDSGWTAIYGNYYNWPAATAGKGTYSTTSGNINVSICPKGWKLPKGEASSVDYSLAKLYSAYGSSASNFRSATNTGTGYWSGYYYSGSLGQAGSYGYWWSRTARNGDYAYGLNTVSSYVKPQYSGNKAFGFSVRCVISLE